MEPNNLHQATSSPVALRTLVVDDRKDMTLSLSMLLNEMGHRVDVAHDADEALRKADAIHPDIIFLDIGLPDQSGYDVCKELRQHSWGVQAYIVALTGRNEPADLLRAANTGFDRHVGKPMELATLKEILHLAGTRVGLSGSPAPLH